MRSVTCCPPRAVACLFIVAALLAVPGLARAQFPEGVIVDTGLAVHALSLTYGVEKQPVGGVGWSVPVLGATVHGKAHRGDVGGYGRFDFDGMFPLVLESLGLPGRGGPTEGNRKYYVQRAFLPPSLELGPFWQLADDFDWGLTGLMSPLGVGTDTGELLYLIDFGFGLQTRLILDQTIIRPFFAYTWSWGEKLTPNESGLVGTALYFGVEAIHHLDEDWWATLRFEWSSRDSSEGKDQLVGGIGTLRVGIGWDLDF